MLYFKDKVTHFACNIFVQILGVFKTIIKSILLVFFWVFLFLLGYCLMALVNI